MKKVMLLCLLCVPFLLKATPTTSLSFNGTNQYVRIPHHADFNVSETESFTVTAWVKYNEYRSENQQRFIAKRDFSGTNSKSGYELWGAQSSSYGDWATNTPNTSGTHAISKWSTTKSGTGNWFHIALVINRDNTTGYMYENGVAEQSATFTNWSVTNTVDVILGAGMQNTSTISYFLNGELANVRFYKKALSAAEVQADMNNNDIDPATEGLVAAYDFAPANIEGTTLKDLCGNHDATMEGYSFECVADNQYTGRGNLYERMLTITKPANVDISSLTLDMTGTTSIADVSKIRIYSSSSNAFDPRDVSGYTKVCEVTPDASGMTTCDLTTTLSSTVSYLFVTYEISETATEGNVVTAKLTTSTTLASREILLRRKLLFAPGDYSSTNYRIPAIVTAHDGSIVVATDKRKYNQTDLPEDIDVMVRRSTDGGVNWAEPITIAEGQGYGAGYGDAALVKTRNQNELLAIYVGGPGFSGATASNPMHVYINKSPDNGLTWTEKVDITNQLYGSTCSDATRSTWQSMFISSGGGMRMSDGTIAFIGVVRETASGGISNYVVYSEDNGTTWQVSSCCMSSNGNEGKITELNDGSWLVSIRNQNKGARYYNISTDRGQTWQGIKQWTELIEPGCNGDILYYTSQNDGYDKNRILHTIPYGMTRQNVCVFVSYDEGSTWPIRKSICKTGAAYSSISMLPDGTIGAFIEENYESGNYHMYFLNFSLNWLTDGQDTYTLPEPEKELAAAPVISPVTTEYVEAMPVEVTMTSTTPGAKIYYTTDGTLPTVSSHLYEGPFSVALSESEKTIVLKAMTVAEGYRNSDFSSVTYTLKDYCHETGMATDRKIISVTFNGGLEAFAMPVSTADNTSRPIYSDFRKATPTLKVSANESTTITPVVKCYNMYWTHLYCYIDYDKSVSFEAAVDASGTPVTVGSETYPELVSYTYYDINGNASTGVNSAGASSPISGVSAGSATDITMPSFIVPALTPGKYIIRVKADWSSIDPCGNPNQSIVSNRGSFIDMTLESVYPTKLQLTETAPALNVYGADSRIVIETTENKSVEVFDTMGRLLKTCSCDGVSGLNFAQGMYIVRANEQVFKVVVK